MKSKPDNNKAEQEYVFSYDADITTIFHASRTAETHAFWFLPHLQPGMKLLDVGCASGSITVGLAMAVDPGQVNGIDISAIEIERAKQKAVEDDLKNVHFEVGDAYQLDFPDNSFDALFSHNVLEHIPDPSRALREMYRILKPAGLIGIRDIDLGGLLISPDNELLTRTLSVSEADWANIGLHPRIGRRLGKLLFEAGFIEVRTSASYEVFNDIESCRLWALIVEGYIAKADFVKRVAMSGLAKAEEVEAWQKAWRAWSELPGAFHARSHCEAIGRKA